MEALQFGGIGTQQPSLEPPVASVVSIVFPGLRHSEINGPRSHTRLASRHRKHLGLVSSPLAAQSNADLCGRDAHGGDSHFRWRTRQAVLPVGISSWASCHSGTYHPRRERLVPIVDFPSVSVMLAHSSRTVMDDF